MQKHLLNPIVRLAVAALFPFVCWLVFAVIFTCISKDLGEWGNAMNSFGALFSGLAFAGVVVAVIFQHQELSLHRETLASTQKELHETALANQKTVEAMEAQIAMQLRAAELSAVSTLLSSVSSQLGPGTSPQGDSLDTLFNARRAYHERLHAILAEMGRGVPLPSKCESIKGR